MPTSTYVALATTTLGASASSVTFSSIPATYRDLVVIIQGTGTSNTAFVMRYNADSGSNYSYVDMGGDGSSASSNSAASDTYVNTLYTTTAQIGIAKAQIMDYSATDKHKTTLIARDNAASFTSRFAGRWANTAAINQIQILRASGNIASGAVISLYGIAS